MVLDFLLLVLAALRAACRRRGDLVVENLLLRHQLAVLTRPTRRRRVRLRRLDKALWVLIRRLRRDWRRHLAVVTPDTVVRWHRAGWRPYWRWRSRSPGGPASAQSRGPGADRGVPVQQRVRQQRVRPAARGAPATGTSTGPDVSLGR